MSVSSYTFSSTANKICPPTPRRPIFCAKSSAGQHIRVVKSAETQSSKYKLEGINLGEWIGQGTFVHVYLDKLYPQQVIKISHYLLGEHGTKHLEAAHATYQELQNCPDFHSSGMSLVPTNLYYTASKMAYLTQKYFSFDNHFLTEKHMNCPGVFNTLQTLFQLCYDGDLPPIDLTPSNLIYLDGKLALIDWHIPYDNDVSNQPGSQFRLHMRSRLDAFGPKYRILLSPKIKEIAYESSCTSVASTSPQLPRPDLSAFSSSSLLELLKKKNALILPDQAVFSPRPDAMEISNEL